MSRTKLYTLTEEHRAQLIPWAQRWIANAKSTAPMSAEEKTGCIDAVRRLYAAAHFPPPRVIFVSSPFVMRFAAGFAAAIWWQKKNATRAATAAATDAMTHDATRDTIYVATDAATRAATPRRDHRIRLDR